MVSAGIAQDTGTPTEDSETREVIEELTQAVRNQEKKIPQLLFPQVSDKGMVDWGSGCSAVFEEHDGCLDSSWGIRRKKWPSWHESRRV